MPRHKFNGHEKICIAFLGMAWIFCGSAAAQQIAYDNGDPNDSDARPGFVNSAYADGWDPGDNGGYGFLPWFDGLFYGNPVEIDADTPEPDNDIGTPAFRFGTGGDQYWAVRPFAAGMQPGQSFRINLDNWALPNETPASDYEWMIGLRSSSGERLSFYAYDYYFAPGGPFFGGAKFGIYATSANNNLAGGASLPTTGCGGGNFCTDYTAVDGSDGFTFQVDVLTANTYRMRIIDDEVTKVDVTGQLQVGTRADQPLIDFFFWGNESTGETHTTYFNNIEILTTPAAPGLDGDYNNDGTVNAADYVLWRNVVGTSTDLPNDPNPVPIDADQYNTWRANFGKPLSGGGSAVPEPSSLMLVVIGLGLVSPRRSKC